MTALGLPGGGAAARLRHRGGVVVDRQNNVLASGFANGGLDGNTNAGDYDALVVKSIRKR